MGGTRWNRLVNFNLGAYVITAKDKLVADLKKAYGPVSINVALKNAREWDAKHPHVIRKKSCSADIDNSQSVQVLGEILTPEEVAERLKVPVSWVYQESDPIETLRSLHTVRLE